MDGDRSFNRYVERADEVGHTDIVATICARVQEQYYYPTAEQKAVMMKLTISRLQVLSERFQKQMRHREVSGLSPNHNKTKQAFEFALQLAYGRPLPIAVSPFNSR